MAGVEFTKPNNTSVRVANYDPNGPLHFQQDDFISFKSDAQEPNIIVIQFTDQELRVSHTTGVADPTTRKYDGPTGTYVFTDAKQVTLIGSAGPFATKSDATDEFATFFENIVATTAVAGGAADPVEVTVVGGEAQFDKGTTVGGSDKGTLALVENVGTNAYDNLVLGATASENRALLTTIATNTEVKVISGATALNVQEATPLDVSAAIVTVTGDDSGSLTIDNATLSNTNTGAVGVNTQRVTIGNTDVVSTTLANTNSGAVGANTQRITIGNTDVVSTTLANTNTGLVGANTQRITVATDDIISSTIATVSNGDQTNAQRVTLANDVSKVLGASSTAGTQRGIQPLAVRKDIEGAPTETTGNYVQLTTNAEGALRTTFGQEMKKEVDQDYTADTQKFGPVLMAVRNDGEVPRTTANNTYTPLQTDAAGRLRVATASTSDVSGRTAISQNVITGDYQALRNLFTGDNEKMSAYTTNGNQTVAFDDSINAVTLSCTNTGIGKLQSYASHPYYSGQPQECEVSMSAFTPQTGVIKRAGYFYHDTLAAPTDADDLDGLFLESQAGTVYFRIVRNGTNIINVAQSAWDDPMDGTGQSGATIDWDNFIVFSINFLYLGGAIATLSFFVDDGSLVVAHTYSYIGVAPNTFINSPNQPATFTISTTGANTGSFNFHCARVATANPVSGYSGLVRGAHKYEKTTEPANEGDILALIGVRLDKVQAINRNVVVYIRSFSTSNNEVTALYDILLMRNPVIADTGTVTWENGRSIAANSLVEFGRANSENNTNVVTQDIEKVIAATSGAYGSSAIFSLTQNVQLGVPADPSQPWDEIWVCVKCHEKKGYFGGTITWAEIF